MEILQYSLRKLLYGVPLILGVTFVAFLLMVYFGPDKTYDLLGKNPTAEEIAEIRHQLGYDRPFLGRYVDYLVDLVTFDFGLSDSTNKRVTSIFADTIPVSVALALPGFILGNLLAIALALVAAYYRGSWEDKAIMVFAVVGMSISFLIVIITFQIIFCASYGLDLFPVSGWEVHGIRDYLKYVTVPTMATIFVSLGYNTRFYRAVIVEEVQRDHVRTARAFGCPPSTLLFKYVLKNCMIPIITRILFTIPFILIGGSLLLETYFGIPGIGLEAYSAITNGDQPVLKAIVGCTALMYVILLVLADILYKVVDPRISLT